jgi:hypothetical protein
MSISELIGSKHQLRIGEETINFSPVSLEIESQFEHKLLAKTKASLQVMKELVTPDEFILLLRSVNDAYALGQYKLVGKNGIEALQTRDGLLILLSLLTGLPEDKCKTLVFKHGAELGSTLSSVLKESIGTSLG